MDGNGVYPSHDNESKDPYGVELVVPNQATSNSSPILEQTINQQETSLNQSDIGTYDTGHQSRKNTILQPSMFGRRNSKRKKGHDVQLTLGAFVEVGLATVVGNNVHDIYEVVSRLI